MLSKLKYLVERQKHQEPDFQDFQPQNFQQEANNNSSGISDNKSRSKSKLKNSRPQFSHLQRNQIAFNQDWKCNMCKSKLQPEFSIDHIIALRFQGSNDASNLQALCANCHLKKSNEENRIYALLQKDKKLKSRYF